MKRVKKGDKVKIVKVVISGGKYKVGDVLTVTRDPFLSGSVFAKTEEGHEVLLFDSEFELRTFRVGDIVAPLPEAEHEYVQTTPSNDFVGEVVKVWPHGDIAVKVLQARRKSPMSQYLVDSKYFREAVSEDFCVGTARTVVLNSDDSTTVIDSAPTDAVAHPSHYTNGKFEVIEVIEEFTQGYEPYEAYCIGNVIKYVARAPHKHETPLEDLKKARQYLDFAIKRIEGES